MGRLLNSLGAMALVQALGDEELAATEARRMAALVGAFVADAAAMPTHWIYDTEELTSILEAENRSDTPEFLSPSHAPFYDYPVGEFTPFGEQMLVYARALAESGKVDPDAIAKSYNAYYTAPMNESRGFSSYYDNATKGFLANYAAGKRWPHTGAGDTETNAIAHVLPVVVMQAGRPGFLKDAEAAIRIVQDNDDAVAFGLTFARLLERVILGDSIELAVKNVEEILRQGTGNPNDSWFSHGLAKMEEWRLRPPFDVTLEISQSCDFPFHIFTASHLLLHGNGSMHFADAVRTTIKLGGENANRGSFIASILAAAATRDPVPESWQMKMTHYQEVLTLARALARGRGEPSISAALAGQGDRGAPAVPSMGLAMCIANSNSTDRPGPRPPSHPDDMAALRALYLATGGPEWTRNACWLNPDIPVCWWDTVSCDDGSEPRVRSLGLAGNNLVGTLPDEIGKLSKLEQLSIGFNRRLGGSLPESFGGLSKLERFYSWNTSFTSIPASIGNLSSLIALDLTDNRLTGRVPASMVQLKSVNTVYLDGNLDLSCPLGPEVQKWLGDIEFHAEICPASFTIEV